MAQPITKALSTPAVIVGCLAWTLWNNKSIRPDTTCIISTDIVAQRLNQQRVRETQKLARRISQNMFDDLQKHREGHRLLEKIRFNKDVTSFSKIPNKSFPS
ncbi:MAG: hypothetical protein JSS60_09280 [Verrucomicrobia bacterium]|nr:hypothetical protein [Verrucomicrobiota bacterium]